MFLCSTCFTVPFHIPYFPTTMYIFCLIYDANNDSIFFVFKPWFYLVQFNYIMFSMLKV